MSARVQNEIKSNLTSAAFDQGALIVAGPLATPTAAGIRQPTCPPRRAETFLRAPPFSFDVTGRTTPLLR
jgi:hypothetical protein